MTSNERIILKCLLDAKGEAHICFISRLAGFSSDYARLLARSLERAGYLKFAGANVCYLLTRGRSRFSAPEERDLDSDGQDSGLIVETAEPDAILNPEEEIADSDSDEKVIDERNGEEKWKEKLDKTIEELESTDGENSEAGDEKLAEEIQNEILEEETKIGELVSDQGQDIEEIKEEVAEIKEEKKAEVQEADLTETKKEEPAKPAGSFGLSFKKVVSWFTEKK